MALAVMAMAGSTAAYGGETDTYVTGTYINGTDVSGQTVDGARAVWRTRTATSWRWWKRTGIKR